MQWNTVRTSYPGKILHEQISLNAPYVQEKNFSR